MDLTTPYLGLSLKNPFVLGASPITTDLDKLARVLDAGVGAVVMHSLFEEQLLPKQAAAEPLDEDSEEGASIPPSMRPSQPRGQPSEEYLEQLVRIKRRSPVPVIASLNGATEQGWLAYARNLEDAGADALELNVYHLSLDPEENAAMLEEQLIQMVRRVTQAVRIPVGVKLSPFYAGLPNLARRLVHTGGARGLTLFNRFYEPDIDVETMTLEPRLTLSTSSELTLRLRWVAALSPKVSASLSVSGGVHTAADAIKAILAGADTVQLVSAVLQRGPQVFSELENQVKDWLMQHAYDGIAQARGSMNLARCRDTTFYRRGNYLKILQSWQRPR